MRFSELPFEILTQIADHLAATDYLSCALVCKGWRYSFQKALWRDIQIYTYHGMQKLIDSINSSKDVPTVHGSWIHSLRTNTCDNNPDITEMQFSELFRHLPNLKSLDLRDRSYKDIYTPITRSYEIWKSLEVLKTQSKGTKEIQSAKNLLELINTCSMLQELEILKEGSGYRTEFCIDDFDSIHQNLQNLSSISAGIYLSSEFSTALDAIPNTTPAFTMTSLDINSKIYKRLRRMGADNRSNWNPLWLYYFGYKYPNLRSLKLHVTDTRHKTIYSDQRKALVSLFQSNPNAFQHVESFELTNDKYFELFDFVLWELFYVLKVPLKHLSLNARSRGFPDNSCPMSLDRILQSFSETLKSLSLSGFILESVGRAKGLELSSYYPLLTNLYINSRVGHLDLDDLLDKLVALKELKLCCATLLNNPKTTADKSKHQHQQHHELEFLTLDNCSVPAEVFTPLSFRCRSLKHMTLHDMWVTGSICEKTGCLLLDMPHTFLKTLNVCYVQFGERYTSISEDEVINMMLLSQLNDAPLTDKNTDREQKEMNSKHPTVASHNIDWLFTFSSSEEYEEYITVTTKLSKERANIVFEYYQNFQSRKTDPILKDNIPYNRRNPETAWEYELYKGYGELRVGNIESSPVICVEKYVEY